MRSVHGFLAYHAVFFRGIEVVREFGDTLVLVVGRVQPLDDDSEWYNRRHRGRGSGRSKGDVENF